MRQFILILLIVLASTGFTQAQTSFECETGLAYTNAISLTVPDSGADFSTITDIDPGYFITVIGLDETTYPLLYHEFEAIGFCQPAPSLYYEASLPSTGEVAAIEQVTQLYSADERDELTYSFANELDSAGDYLLIVEGGMLEADAAEGDIFTLEYDPATPINVTAYVLPVTEDFDPLVTLLDENSNPLADAEGVVFACDNAGEDCYSEPQTLTDAKIGQVTGELLSGTANSAYLPVPGTVLDTGQITLRVDSANQPGRYLMALHITQGAAAARLPLAQLNEIDETITVLRCDDILYEEVIVLDMADVIEPDEAALTLTVSGDIDFEPVVALVDESDTGNCYMADGNTVIEYGASLPGVSLAPTENAVQVSDFAGKRVVIAGQGAFFGEVTIFVEGITLDTAEMPDIHHISVPVRLPETQPELTAYMVAMSDLIDPFLTATIPGEADPLTCDNAGLVDECDQNSSDLFGSQLILNGVTVQVLTIDAMLALPYHESGRFSLESSHVSLEGEPEEAGNGEYILVWHIIIP